MALGLNSWGGFTGINGETYLSSSGTLYQIFGGANNREWYWISGELPKNWQGQTKKFYKLITDSSDSLTTEQVDIDGGGFTALDGDKIDNSSYPQMGKTAKIKLAHGSNGTSDVTVDSTELEFRRLHVK